MTLPHARRTPTEGEAHQHTGKRKKQVARPAPAIAGTTIIGETHSTHSLGIIAQDDLLHTKPQEYRHKTWGQAVTAMNKESSPSSRRQRWIAPQTPVEQCASPNSQGVRQKQEPSIDPAQAQPVPQTTREGISHAMPQHAQTEHTDTPSEQLHSRNARAVYGTSAAPPPWYARDGPTRACVSEEARLQTPPSPEHAGATPERRSVRQTHWEG